MSPTDRTIERLPAAITFHWEEVHDEDLDRDLGKTSRISKTLTAWDGLIDDRSLLTQRYSQDIGSKRALSDSSSDEASDEESDEGSDEGSNEGSDGGLDEALSEASTKGPTPGNEVTPGHQVTPRRAANHPGNRKQAPITPMHASSFSQIGLGSNTRVSAHTIRLLAMLKERFDSRFLMLDLGTPGHQDILERAEAWCRSKGQKIRSKIAKLVEKGKLAKGTKARQELEKEQVRLVIEYFDGIGEALMGKVYLSPFRDTGSGPIKDGDRSKPDLAILLKHLEEKDKAEIGDCLAFWEFKISQALEMNRDEVVVPLMRFTQNLSQAHNMIGHMIAFSCCGNLIRMFHIDAFSFSTTKPADLNNPDHISDIVKMVSLCLGPVENIMSTWQPNKEDLAHMHPQMADWTGVELKVLPGSRRDLCGRRTMVWFVKLRLIDILVKASWLPKDMLEHEYGVLQHMAKAKQTAKAKQSNTSGTSDTAANDETIKACRFDLLEKITGWEEIFGRFPSPIGLKKGRHLVKSSGGFSGITKKVPAYPGGNQLECLELGVLVMQGPVADATPRLSLIQTIDVCTDYNLSLQVSSCFATHFRDINTGNLRYQLVEGRTRGVLIDFGGATVAGKHRKQSASVDEMIAFCKDDALSANLYFVSTVALANKQIAEDYEAARAQLATAEGSSGDRNSRRFVTAQRKFDKAKDSFDRIVRHRYIDDMESMIYYMIYNGLVDIGEKIKAEQLADPKEKATAWNRKFDEVFKNLKELPRIWKKMITDLIDDVQGCRLELEEIKRLNPQAPDPVELTDAEFDCFVRCHQIKVKAKEDLLEREVKKAAKVERDARGVSRQAKKVKRSTA